MAVPDWLLLIYFYCCPKHDEVLATQPLHCSNADQEIKLQLQRCPEPSGRYKSPDDFVFDP